ncbi:hypothetical protein [Streptomyces sp. LaBMicrA B280]|uniref:hypothetical protein n=1 Tax=Streptomyces sp. LaBMicrA B280 TaxID=3391001 RepID=UPI003BA67533
MAEPLAEGPGDQAREDQRGGVPAGVPQGRGERVGEARQGEEQPAQQTADMVGAPGVGGPRGLGEGAGHLFVEGGGQREQVRVAVPVLDRLGGEALGLQQGGDLVGVDGGADPVGEFGGQQADGRLVGAEAGQPQGQGAVVGAGEPEGEGVLFGAARLQGHGSAHPARLPAAVRRPASRSGADGVLNSRVW